MTDDSAKERWRRRLADVRDTAKVVRSEDRFSAAFEAALRGTGTRREPGPPSRRPPHAVGRWFKRGKLWDDVFTRTVANVLSIGILAVLAALTGLIQFDRQAWAVVVLVGGLLLAVLIVNIAPVRYLKRQGVRLVVFIVLAAAVLFVAWRLYGSLPTLPAPSDSECSDVIFC